MGKQTNIFEFSTQKDRLEAAYQLMSAVYNDEDIQWGSVQTAVNCQVAANRLVWKVNDTYFDTPEWNPDEHDDLPLMKWTPCKEKLPDHKCWCIVTEWSTEEQKWDVTMDKWIIRDGQEDGTSLLWNTFVHGCLCRRFTRRTIYVTRRQHQNIKGFEPHS